MYKLPSQSSFHSFHVKELIHQGCLHYFSYVKVVGLKVIISLIYAACGANHTSVFRDFLACSHNMHSQAQLLKFKTKDWERILYKHMWLPCPRLAMTKMLTYIRSFFCWIEITLKHPLVSPATSSICLPLWREPHTYELNGSCSCQAVCFHILLYESIPNE